LKYAILGNRLDVSDFWRVKIDAVKAYESQLRNSHCDAPSLLERIEVSGRYFGQYAKTMFAEPFVSCEPILFKNLDML